MRVNRVKKSRKEQGTCGKCGVTLPAGGAYIWWKFRYGGKRKRCTKPECYPKRSDLTQNEVLTALYDLQDDIDDRIAKSGSVEDLGEIRDDAGEQIQEIIDVIQEKLDNIEEGFGHTSAPIYEELDSRRDEYESWMSEIEGVEFDEYDSDEYDDRDGWVEAQRDVLRDLISSSPE